MAEVKMNHPLVNSGNDIVLESAKISYSFKNLNEAKSMPGKFDIVESENVGFENPKISISGNWDVDRMLTDGLDQELLISLAIVRSEVPIKLTIKTGNSNKSLGGRPTAGYSTEGSNILLDDINFIIDSFDIKIGANSDLAHSWDYSIIGKETL